MENAFCTSILDTASLRWSKVKSQINLPYGGYLLSGRDLSRVFYIGGRNATTVYELDEENVWKLSHIQLPFAMSIHKSYFSQGSPNLTECAQDHDAVLI